MEPEQFGKTHFNLLLYCESCAVDYKGQLDIRRMTINSDKRGYGTTTNTSWKPLYASTCVGNVKPDPMHDELDALEYLEDAGYLENIGTDLNPFIKLSDKGWQIAHELRRHKANGGNYNNFEPSVK